MLTLRVDKLQIVCYTAHETCFKGGEKMQTTFRIRDLRQAVPMTQHELAKQLGYKSASAITMWESGERKPPSTILPQLAKALDCEVADLFSDC